MKHKAGNGKYKGDSVPMNRHKAANRAKRGSTIGKEYSQPKPRGGPSKGVDKSVIQHADGTTAPCTKGLFAIQF